MRTAVWLAGLVLSVGAPVASAEDLTPSRVTVRMDGAAARLVVTARFKVTEVGALSHTLPRPSRAVVIAGSVTDADGKHAMTLTPADDAEAAHTAIAAAPVTRTRASFFVVSDSGGHIAFDGLAHRRGMMTVEIELAAPTCFDHDARYVSVPTGWIEALPEATQRRVDGGDELTQRCDKNVDTHASSVWISMPARKIAGPIRINATAARFSDGKEQAARLELAIANTLADIPGDLHTAFVVDTSRSMLSDQQTAARAVIRSYLAHAPRSSVQVIGYARTANALLERWMTAGKAAKTIDALLAKAMHRNGSELQVGLREAGAWLERVPGTRRVIILSDARVADRIAKLSAATLAKALPAGTLVHVVALSNGDLVRDDDARWAPLAALTEGIAMRGGLEALPLVRPVSLDHVRITAPNWSVLEGPEAACIAADTLNLAEGQACTWWGLSTAGESLEVEGLLWNRRWRKTVALGGRTDLALARQLRFVFDPAADLAIAALDAAKAVSDRWSLVARWGGAGGYADMPAGGGTGWGTICDCGNYGTIGHGSGTGSAVDVSPSLQAQLFEAVGRCTRDDLTIALTVETTLDEIVDVSAIVTLRNHKGAPTDAQAIATCVEEAVWGTNIKFAQPRSHATAQLTF